MPDKLQNLYDTFVADGYEMEPFEDFKNNLKDAKKRRAAYDALVNDGYDMEDYSAFEKNIGMGEVPASSPATPATIAASEPIEPSADYKEAMDNPALNPFAFKPERGEATAYNANGEPVFAKGRKEAPAVARKPKVAEAAEEAPAIQGSPSNPYMGMDYKELEKLAQDPSVMPSPEDSAFVADYENKLNELRSADDYLDAGDYDAWSRANGYSAFITANEDRYRKAKARVETAAQIQGAMNLSPEGKANVERMKELRNEYRDRYISAGPENVPPGYFPDSYSKEDNKFKLAAGLMDEALQVANMGSKYAPGYDGEWYEKAGEAVKQFGLAAAGNVNINTLTAGLASGMSHIEARKAGDKANKIAEQAVKEASKDFDIKNPESLAENLQELSEKLQGYADELEPLAATLESMGKTYEEMAQNGASQQELDKYYAEYKKKYLEYGEKYNDYQTSYSIYERHKGDYDKLQDAVDAALEKDLSEGDKALLDALGELTDIQAKRSLDTSVAANAGLAAEQSAEFMLDFILTGGLSKGGAKLSTKIATGAIRRRLGKTAVRGGLTNIADDVPAALAKLSARGIKPNIGARMLSDVAVAAERTALMFPRNLKAYGDALTEMAPAEATGIENPSANMQFSRGWVNAGINTAITQYIEYWSEGFGEYFGAAESALWKNATKRAPITAIGKTLKDYRGSIGRYLDNGKFDGMFNEMLEEVVGSLFNSAAGWLSGDRVGDSDAIKDFASGEQLSTLFFSFLPMSMFSAGTNLKAYSKMRDRYNEAVATLQPLMESGAVSSEDLDALVSHIEAASPKELKNRVVAIADKARAKNGRRLPENFAKSLMGYVEGSLSMQMEGDVWRDSAEKAQVAQAYAEQYGAPVSLNAWDAMHSEALANNAALEAGFSQDELDKDPYRMAQDALAIKETDPERSALLLALATAKAQRMGLKDGYEEETNAMAQKASDDIAQVSNNGSVIYANLPTGEQVIVTSKDASVENGKVVVNGGDGVVTVTPAAGAPEQSVKSSELTGAITRSAADLEGETLKDLYARRKKEYNYYQNRISVSGKRSAVGERVGQTVYISDNSGVYEPVTIVRSTQDGDGVVITGDKEVLSGVAALMGMNVPKGRNLEVPSHALYDYLAKDEDGSISTEQPKEGTTTARPQAAPPAAPKAQPVAPAAPKPQPATATPEGAPAISELQGNTYTISYNGLPSVDVEVTGVDERDGTVSVNYKDAEGNDIAAPEGAPLKFSYNDFLTAMESQPAEAPSQAETPVAAPAAPAQPATPTEAPQVAAEEPQPEAPKADTFDGLSTDEWLQVTVPAMYAEEMSEDERSEFVSQLEADLSETQEKKEELEAKRESDKPKMTTDLASYQQAKKELREKYDEQIAAVQKDIDEKERRLEGVRGALSEINTRYMPFTPTGVKTEFSQEELEPHNPEEAAAKFISDQLRIGKKNGKPFYIDTKSFKEETGFKGETKSFFMLFKKGGSTIGRLAEDLADAYPALFGGGVNADQIEGTASQRDDQAARDAILSLFGKVRNTTDINNYILNNRKADAAREAARQNDEIIHIMEERFGMPIEEYESQREAIIRADLEEMLAFPIEGAGFLSNLREYYKEKFDYVGPENSQGNQVEDAGDESGAAEPVSDGGGEVLPGAQSVGGEGQESVGGNPSSAESTGADTGAGDGAPQGGRGLQAPVAEEETPEFSVSDIDSGRGGRFYKNKKGNIDLVKIADEVFAKMGVSPLPFRVTESMAKHVYEQHAEELGLDSLSDAVEFVVEVMSNFDHVRQGDGDTYIFSVEEGRTRIGKRAIAIVVNAEKGNFLGIKTSGYDRLKKIQKRPILWEKGANETSTTGAAPANVTSRSASESGQPTGSASNQSSGLSGNKDTESSETSKENGQNIAEDVEDMPEFEEETSEDDLPEFSKGAGISADESARQQPFVDRVRQWEDRIGVKIGVVTSKDQVKSKQALAAIEAHDADPKLQPRVRGWFDPNTKQVVVYLPHILSEKDIDATYLHEVISHKGLRELLGEDRFNKLMDFVWNDLMSVRDRARFMAYNDHLADSLSLEELRRAAADEFIAHFSESINPDLHPSKWNRFVAKFKLFLKELGIDIKLNAKDLEAELRASLANYEERHAEASENAQTGEEVRAENQRFSKVTDEALLNELNNGPTFKAYRAMAFIEDENGDVEADLGDGRGMRKGRLYSPMATQERDEKGKWSLRTPTDMGAWEQSDEHPEKAVEQDGKWVYILKKPDGSTVPAAYNPYIHTSLIPLNDQFTAAHKRPELVTVEVEVPESELTSGYKAEKAKNAVGKMPWHAGPVAGQLPEGRKREVVLSRYDRPVRVVPNSEVADKIVEAFKGVKTEPFPWNVFTPALRAELAVRGVKFSDEPSGTVSKKDIEAYKNSKTFFSKVSADRKQDTDYLTALESGNEEEVRRQVRAAAEKAGVKDLDSVPAVAYDDEGIVIPLSERFKPDGEDIRFSKAWHGSGQEFDRFDHAFIGSGEGAAAHGWGTYVSFNEDTARGYADKLSGMNRAERYQRNAELESMRNMMRTVRQEWYNTQEGTREKDRLDHEYDSLFKRYSYKQLQLAARDAAVRYKKLTADTPIDELSKIADATRMIHWAGSYKKAIEKYKGQEVGEPGVGLYDAYHFLLGTKESDWETTRNLYTVEVPEDNGDNYLRESAPAKRLDVLVIWGKLVDLAEDDVALYLNLPDYQDFLAEYEGKPNEELYYGLTKLLGGKKEASLFLSDLGYVGIKYNGYTDGECAVIFDENNVQITERLRFSKVYHGTGADFERFDHSHMGEGEGSQSYGWGTYVTSNRETGLHYAQTIGGSDEQYERAMRSIESQQAQDERALQKATTEEERARLQADIALMEQRKEQMKRHLYTVEIPDDNGQNYLHWDEPITKEQSDKIIAAVKERTKDVWYEEMDYELQSGLGPGTYGRHVEGGLDYFLGDMKDYATGKDPGAERNSKLLNSLGIVGIEIPIDRNGGKRYQGSNYVIFNEDDLHITEHLRFSLANENQEIFVSNAARAVENIKQEKATPQQWLAQIEKNGGLKAGEDKWIGLSDWLKASDRKTLTKQEVLDYINQNKIQIEEVNYAEEPDGAYDEALASYREEFQNFVEEGKALGFTPDAAYNFDEDEEDEIRETRNAYDYAYYKMVDTYGDDFEMAFERDGENLAPKLEPWSEDYSDAAKYFLRQRMGAEAAEPINDTRLTYTTYGLEDKREIALTVPTIEPWNEDDDIHFGDAGEGRAVAWIRFGDAYTGSNPGYMKGSIEYAGPKSTTPRIGSAIQGVLMNWNDNESVMRNIKPEDQFFAARSMFENALRDNMDSYTPEQRERAEQTLAALTELKAEDFVRSEPNGNKVLFIDEIQSKRHQEGRERGYKTSYEEREKALFEKFPEYKEVMDGHARAGELANKITSETGRPLTGLFREDFEKFKPEIDEYNRLELAYHLYMKNHGRELQNNADALDGLIPAAPFEKNWHELAFKRMLRLAAEEGYDYVAWTTGEQQAKRYDMGSVLNHIEAGRWATDEEANDGRRYGEESKALTLYTESGEISLDINRQGTVLSSDMEEMNGKPLHEVLGKELAVKIISEDGIGEYSGEGLRVGGEGMRGFYDDILPRFANKYGKKWGVKVQDISLPDIGLEGGLVAHAIPVTPEMKESVMGGQVMFSKVGGEEIENNSNFVDNGRNQETASQRDNAGGRDNGSGVRGQVLGRTREQAVGDRSRVQDYISGLYSPESNGNRDGGERRRRPDKAVSERLIEIARETGDFIKHPEGRSEYSSLIGQGSESEVFRKPDFGDVRKFKKPFAAPQIYWKFPNATGFENVIYEHLASNILFPETRQEFRGVSENYKGEVEFVLDQPFVLGRRKATDEEIGKYLEPLGFKNVKKVSAPVYSDGHVALHDCVEGNVLVDKNGKLHFIDVAVQFLENPEDALRHETEKMERLAGESTKEESSPVSPLANSVVVGRAIDDLGDKLHVKVNKVTREQMPKGYQSKKGYFNPRTREVYVCTDNVASVDDAIATVMHEAVAHLGLRRLLGDQFPETMRSIYEALDRETRRKVNASMSANGWDAITAMEEYMAGLAEKEAENFTQEEKNLWQKIKDIFQNVLAVLTGRKTNLTDNDLRYILRASYENLRNPRYMETVQGWAKDLAMKSDLKVNDYVEPEYLFRAPTFEDGSNSIKNYEEAMAKTWQIVQMEFQDGQQPVRVGINAIQAETGNKPIEEDEDYIAKENHASSISQTEQTEFLLQQVEPIIEQVRKIQQKLHGAGKMSTNELKAEYQNIITYLLAKHGLERNRYSNAELAKQEAAADAAKMAAEGKHLTDAERKQYESKDWSGLTSLFNLEKTEHEDAELLADDLVKQFENKVGDEDVNALWDAIRAATDYNLKHALDHGLLSRAEYDKLHGNESAGIPRMWEYYIPLRGFDEKTAEDRYDYHSLSHSGSGGQVVEKYKGRSTRAQDPIANIIAIGESEIVQGNRNLAKIALYKFALNRSDNKLLAARDVWYEKQPDGKWMAAEPMPGESLEQFEDRMQTERQNGLARIGKKGLALNMIMAAPQHSAEHLIHLKINGVDKAIWVNGNPVLARAVDGWKKRQNDFERAARNITRNLSNIFTTYSINFTARNLSRDILYSEMRIMAIEDSAYRWAFRKHRLASLAQLNIPMMRLISQWNNGTLQQKAHPTERERLFMDFMRDGGVTGYTIAKNVESVKKDIMRAVTSGRTRSAARFVLGLYFNGTQALNESFELLTRFTAYRTSREMGRSRQEAASNAKEISVNFNTKGAQSGEGVWGIIASYLGWSHYFINAAMQGFQNFVDLYKRHPYKMTGMTAMLISGGILTPFINALLAAFSPDGDDDDWYWTLPQWVRRNNIIIGWKGFYLAMPLGPEQRALYGMGDACAALIQNKVADRRATSVIGDFVSQAAGVLPFNPIEDYNANSNIGETAVRAIAPDVTMFFVDWLSNRDYTGTPLVKKNPYGIDPANAFSAYSNTPQGIVKACLKLSQMSGGAVDLQPGVVRDLFKQYGGGVYSFFEGTAKSLSSLTNPNKPTRASDIPFFSGFIGHLDEDRKNSFLTNALNDYQSIEESVVHRMQTMADDKSLTATAIFSEDPPEAVTRQRLYEGRNYAIAKMYFLGNKDVEKLRKQWKKECDALAAMPYKTDEEKRARADQEDIAGKAYVDYYNAQHELVEQLLNYEHNKENK